MTHTKGPWKAELERGVPAEPLYVIVRPEAFTEWELSAGMTEDDCCLISAAPELLEMLRKLQWFRDDDGTQICPSCNAYGNGFVDDIIRHKPDCKLSALLQKARGE